MCKKDAVYLRVSHRDQSHSSQLPNLERRVKAQFVFTFIIVQSPDNSRYKNHQ